MALKEKGEENASRAKLSPEKKYKNKNNRRSTFFVTIICVLPASILILLSLHFRAQKMIDKIIAPSTTIDNQFINPQTANEEEERKRLSRLSKFSHETFDNKNDKKKKTIQFNSLNLWQLSGGKLRNNDTTTTQEVDISSSSITSHSQMIAVRTRLGGRNCECDLISIECLSSINCIIGNDDDVDGSSSSSSINQKEELIVLGILTRKLMKMKFELTGRTLGHGYYPIGMSLQHAIIDSWTRWKNERILPYGFVIHEEEPDTFINETKYPYCRRNNLTGKRCFFKDLNSTEDIDWIEMKALQNFVDVSEDKYDDLVQDFSSKIIQFVEKDLEDFWDLNNNDDIAPPALGSLLTFAHIGRMLFNRQKPFHIFYDNHYKVILGINGPLYHTKSYESKRLRVGLHIRRADACIHENHGFKEEKSPLMSDAQVSGRRNCYATSVYMKELRKVQDIVGKNKRHIDVYLSTDYAGSVLDDIKTNHPDLYETMNWHYLDYSRKVFQYESVIEDPANNKRQQEKLGETAVADLWHLSHSEIFIGHLGSRFGKLGWLLATSRHNTFIPFSTVDGHSFCCEVDENCGQMKPYITSIGNCMTFTHATTHLSGNIEINKDYWEVGSTVRIKFAELQEKRKKKKKRKHHHHH